MVQENKQIAIIAGCTGLVGHELLQLLQNDPTYKKIYCLVRSPRQLVGSKIVEKVIDFDQLPESLDSMSDADTIFCCLGTTIKNVGGSQEAFRKVDHDYPVALAKWGEKNNIKQFLVISAMGADPKSSIFYSRTKGEMERDIFELNIPSITVFRPSLLIGDRKENRVGEKIGIFLSKILSFLFIGPLKNYKGVHVKKVAKAMMKASQQSGNGKRVVLSGEMLEMK